MAEDAAQDLELPGDQFVARVFTIADHADAVAATGKLYINGAGVTVVWMDDVPGTLPTLYIALRLTVPWQHTNEPIDLKIRALNADRTPAQRDPLFELAPEVGRPSGFRTGDELAINGAFGIGGLPVASHGTIYFHLEVNGRTIAVHPLKIAPLQPAPTRLRP